MRTVFRYLLACAFAVCVGLQAEAQSIIAAEYFIDTDQGVGANQPITIITPADSVSLDSIPIDITGYSPGYHWLFFRAMRENGAWGTTVSRRIYIYPQGSGTTTSEPVLSQAEYIIDAPPIPGTGTLLDLPGDTLVFYNDTLNTQLDTGLHVVHVRARDSEGKWGFFHTDTMRVEFYDYDVVVSGPPFIRNGLSYPYTVTVKNRSTVYAADKLLRFMTTRPFTIDMSPPSDTIAGVDVSNVSAIAKFTDESLWTGSIWLPPIAPQSQITIGVRVSFSQLINGTDVEMNWTLEGDDDSDFALRYMEDGGSTPVKTSRYVSSLAQTFALFQDSIGGFPTLGYGTLLDTVQHFFVQHPEVLSSPQFLGKLMKPVVYGTYGTVADSIISLMNVWNENVLTMRSYDGHSDPADTLDAGLTEDFRDGSDCSCTDLACLTGIHIPFLDYDCFEITSTCKQRCYCDCSSGVYKRKNRQHLGYDISAKWKPSCKQTRDLFTDSDVPVRAIHGGTLRYYPCGGTRGSYVEIDTNICGVQLRTRYMHLSGDTNTPCVSTECAPCTTNVIGGSIVGNASNSGLGNGGRVHLHIEFEVDASAVGPLCLLESAFGPPSTSASRPFPCLPLEEDECKLEVEDRPCPANYRGMKLEESRRCPSSMKQKGTCKKPRPVAPVDPNIKVGLDGVGISHALLDSMSLAYGILFANSDSATAPAQVISIIDTLSTEHLDVASVRLPYVLAGDLGIDLPPRPLWEPLDTVLTHRSVNGVYLGIHALVDTTSGILQIELSAHDTISLLPVSGALEGVLPPDTNDYDGRGMAYITITPRLATASHTTVCNDAYIVFDGNPPVHTGEFCNLMDGKGPQSIMAPLPETTPDSSFVVSWSGTDSLGSGVAFYDIYYAVDQDTIFQPWLEGTDTTSAEFNGSLGSTYYFYSVAIDSVGNREEEGLHFDAYTTVTVSTPIGSYQDPGMNLSLFPNPTTGSVTLRGRAESGCHLGLVVRNAVGQELLTKTIGVGPGPILEQVDLSRLAVGTYFVTVNCNDSKLLERLIRISD